MKCSFIDIFIRDGQWVSREEYIWDYAVSVTELYYACCWNTGERTLYIFKKVANVLLSVVEFPDIIYCILAKMIALLCKASYCSAAFHHRQHHLIPVLLSSVTVLTIEIKI